MGGSRDLTRVLLAVICCWLLAHGAQPAAAAFLSSELPLEPVLSTPTELLEGKSIQLVDLQTLTVRYDAQSGARPLAARRDSMPLYCCFFCWPSWRELGRVGRSASGRPDQTPHSSPNINAHARIPSQVVFSRPVIALGSDFGHAALPAAQVRTRTTRGCPEWGPGAVHCCDL